MSKLIKGRNVVSLLFVFLAGVTFIWWVIHSTNNHMKAELLEKARIAAYAVNIEDITSLSGSEKDLSNPAYLRIKSQLAVMRKAKQQCRFLYLMGRRSDGTVFFFVDSLSEGSKDYASPGLVYEEVSDSYLNVFTNCQEAVVGPVTDRWGTSITALVPLKIPHTGNLLAVLGMDVDANDWYKKIIGKAIFPFVIFALFLCLGITLVARGHAIESLRKSEEKYQSLFGNAQVALFRTNIDGKLAEINKRYAQMAGYEKVEDCIAEFNSRDAWADPDDRDELLKILRDRGYVNDYETKIIRRDGGSLWIAFSAKIFSEQRYIEGSIVDITERKQAEKERDKLQAQLLHTQKMESIGTLAGGIAHDFNNILSPLVGYAEMLKENIPQDNPHQKYIDQIIKAAFRARDLVQQILTFGRKGDNKMKPIKLHPIVKEGLKLLRASIPTNIDIQHDIDSSCDAVMADPTQIHQIVMNLATNAYHAMEATGGTLKVGLKQVLLEPKPLFFEDLIAGEYVRLTVADTGIGIGKDIWDKVFDPYFTTKEQGRGTGLGLSVVQGIVKSCNGGIRIESSPGNGTEVQIYLPIIALNSIEKSLEPVQLVQGGNERILLVDDEEAIVHMEQMMLERLGYHVATCTSSLEALTAFRSSPDGFDLVITDMTMPNMTGDRLAKELNLIKPGIPIILCTGFSARIDEQTAKANGINGFLMKPVSKSDMAQMVRKVLDEVKR